MNIIPFESEFGASIHGFDLSCLDNDDEFQKIKDAIYKFKVVAIMDQNCDVNLFHKFVHKFGRPFSNSMFSGLETHPEILEISRSPHSNKKLFGETWHSDQAYEIEDVSFTILHGVTIPPCGGDTLFCNQVAAYNVLPDDLKNKIENTWGLFNLKIPLESLKKKNEPFRVLPFKQDLVLKGKYIMNNSIIVSESLKKLVRTHPFTNEKVLFVAPQYLSSIPNLTEEESKSLITTLTAHATDEKFLLKLKWKPNMIVIWDNRLVLHKATGGHNDYERTLHRVVITEKFYQFEGEEEKLKIIRS
jgi:taurine dioxygenase